MYNHPHSGGLLECGGPWTWATGLPCAHEKSRFVKDHDRWLYHESIPLSQASSAAWIVSTTPNYVDPAQAHKSFSKSKPQANVSPRKS